jgi:hypothetical protein
MASILAFRKGGVFEPDDVEAMSVALDDICETLKLENPDPAREVIAARIIGLARNGELSPALLRERVLKEAGIPEDLGLS